MYSCLCLDNIYHLRFDLCFCNKIKKGLAKNKVRYENDRYHKSFWYRYKIILALTLSKMTHQTPRIKKLPT